MWQTILFGGAIAASIGAGCLLIMALKRLRRADKADFGGFGNGLLGVTTMAALLAGAWIYVLAGETRARIGVSAVATLVPLAPTRRGEARALLQVVGTVSNRGRFSETMDCVGVDVRGFRASGELRRNAIFQSDVESDALLRETTTGPQWNRCSEVERRRWLANEEARVEELGMGDIQPFIPTDSGHRYDGFDIDPGGFRTRDVEVVVPCRYAGVRINFIVPEPDRHTVQEAKTIISLAETCRASREMGGPRRSTPPPAAQTRIEFGDGPRTAD